MLNPPISFLSFCDRIVVGYIVITLGPYVPITRLRGPILSLQTHGILKIHFNDRVAIVVPTCFSEISSDSYTFNCRQAGGKQRGKDFLQLGYDGRLLVCILLTHSNVRASCLCSRHKLEECLKVTFVNICTFVKYERHVFTCSFVVKVKIRDCKLGKKDRIDAKCSWQAHSGASSSISTYIVLVGFNDMGSPPTLRIRARLVSPISSRVVVDR